MPDSWNTAELVAECERLRERLLLRADDEARERYRRIAELYLTRARTESRVEAGAAPLSRPDQNHD
jgi:hypothetical protein